MNNITGKPVYGADFFGRDEDLSRIRQRLRSDNVLLLGPRRVGKTSLLHALLDRERGSGGIGFYTSVASLRTEHDFVQALVDRARELDPGMLSRLLASPAWKKVAQHFPKDVQLGEMVVHLQSEDWRPLAADLLRVLQTSGTTLIAIDEFPNLVVRLVSVDRERARSFLDWFRDVRIARSAAHLRWLLTGSIGLDAVLRQAGLLPSINDLLPAESLGAFSEPIARDFLGRLCADHQIQHDDALIAAMLDCAGWPLPYFLQLLFHELRRNGTALCPSDVSAARDRLLRQHSAFEHWRSRLTEQHGESIAGHARAILGAVAKPDKPVRKRVLENLMQKRISNPDQRADMLGQLLISLETDGYLVREGEQFSFRSGLLQAWWRRNHV